MQELFFAFTLDLDGDKIVYKNILSNSFSIRYEPTDNSITDSGRFLLRHFLYFGKI